MKNIIRGILLHISVICTIASIIISILDWYNPYMDFAGHAAFVQYVLYASVILLAFTEQILNGRRTKQWRQS